MSMMLLLIYFVLNAILFSTSVAFIITCFGSNAYKECFTQYGTLVFCRNFDVPDGHTGIALVSGNEQGHMVIKQLMLVHDSENGGDTCSTAGFLMYAIHNESFGSYLEDMHCIIRNERREINIDYASFPAFGSCSEPRSYLKKKGRRRPLRRRS